ncbi:MAG: hypothetical protein ACKVOH_01170, partial [Chlamydiales bacterium]
SKMECTEIFVFPGASSTLTKVGNNHCFASSGSLTNLIEIDTHKIVAVFQHVGVPLVTDSYYYIDRGGVLEITCRTTEAVIFAFPKKRETLCRFASESEGYVALVFRDSDSQSIVVIDVHKKHILLEEGPMGTIHGVEFIGKTFLFFQHETGRFTEIGCYNFITKVVYTLPGRLSCNPEEFSLSHNGTYFLLFPLSGTEEVHVYNMHTTDRVRIVAHSGLLMGAAIHHNRLITYAGANELMIQHLLTGRQHFYLICDLATVPNADHTLSNIQNNILAIKAKVEGATVLLLIDLLEGIIIRKIEVDNAAADIYFSGSSVRECFPPEAHCPRIRMITHHFQDPA